MHLDKRQGAAIICFIWEQSQPATQEWMIGKNIEISVVDRHALTVYLPSRGKSFLLPKCFQNAGGIRKMTEF